MSLFCAADQERVMAVAPGAAAGPLNGSDTVANGSTGQRDERGQGVMTALPRHDRPEVRRINLGRRGRAGECDRAGLAMAAVEIHVASDQRIFVRSGRQLGQKLGIGNARRSGRDRRERAAILGGRFRLGIEEIEVARAAAQPDEQDGFGPGCLGGRCERRAGGRQSKRSRKAGAQERAPRDTLARSTGKASHLEHPIDPRLRGGLG